MSYLIVVLIAIAWLLALTGIAVWLSRLCYGNSISLGNQVWFASGVVWILSRFINL